MRRSVFVLGALCAAMLAAASLAAQTPPKEVTLAATYKAGDVTRHKSKIVFSSPTGEGTLTSTSVATVKEIRKNGDIVVNSTMENAHISMGGNEQDLAEAPAVVEVHTKAGRLVELKVDETQQMPFTPEVQRTIVQLSEVLFPDKAVAPAGTWQTELTNPMVKGKKLTVKSTYTGTEKLDTLECWKVKQTCDADTEDAGAKMKVEATFWLDPANGRIVKMEGTAKDIPSQLGPIAFTTTQTLIKP